MSRIITPGPAVYTLGADNSVRTDKGKTVIASPDRTARVQVLTRETPTESFVSVSDTVTNQQGDMSLALKQQTRRGHTQTVLEVSDPGWNPDDGDSAVVRIPLGVDVTGGKGEEALKDIQLQ